MIVLTESTRTNNKVLVAHRHAGAQQRSLIEAFEEVRRGKRVRAPQTTEALEVARVCIHACDDTRVKHESSVGELVTS